MKENYAGAREIFYFLSFSYCFLGFCL